MPAVRALKMHGGGPAVTAGKPLDHAYKSENVELVQKGCCNLAKHIENCKKYGMPVVVAMNKFATDTDAELAAVREAAIQAGEKLCPTPAGVVCNSSSKQSLISLCAGAVDAVVCEHHAKGGAGAADLGRAVMAACKEGGNFKFLYPLQKSIKVGKLRHLQG